MKLFGFRFFERKGGEASLDAILQRLEAAFQSASGITVTPENCEESPTVQAIVNAIASHIVTLPVHVFRKSTSDGRERKEPLPNHPVARLLGRPNAWQTPANYWADAASVLVRYGRYYAVKLRGQTGPIRALVPVNPGAVDIRQDDDLEVSMRIMSATGAQRDYTLDQIHVVRNRASDFLTGDSPVVRAREAIGVEIAAQRFGATFFANGGMPGLVFKFMQGVQGFTTPEQREDFLRQFEAAYSGKKRFRGMVLPAGLDLADPVKIDNDKAQFLETRKLQRTVIAGAFGVPPHLVGDLERGTFSNIEHQSQEFTQKVVLPYLKLFEGAMERDLLTDEDRRSGVVIRFNMDAALRADFKTRQEGLKIQREAGVISPNDWREIEGRNPIAPDQGGDTYWQQGPSGQTGQVQTGAQGDEGNQ